MFRTTSFSASGQEQGIHQYIPPDLRRMFYKNPARVHASHNGLDPYSFSTDGLVMYLPLWALDNGGTNSIQSVDAYGLTCTITGALWRPNHRWFDGSDDKISIAGLTRPTTNMTVIVWAYPEVINADEPLVSAWETGNEELLIFRVNSTGKIYVALQQSDHSTVDNVFSDNVTQNAWEMFTLVASVTAGTFRVYQGTSLDAGTDTYDGTLNGDGTDPILLASRSTNRFKGRQGEAWIYDSAYSLADIIRHNAVTKWRY